jgi:hypothetical protein
MRYISILQFRGIPKIISMDHWEGLDGILSLEIDGCDGFLDSHFTFFPNVTDLTIKNSSFISDVGFTHLHHIEKLSLHETTNITSEAFINQKELKHLKVSNCTQTSPKFLEHLGNRLESLVWNRNSSDQYNCFPRDVDLQFLSNIKSLSLNWCNLIGSGFKYCPEIKVLKLANCPYLLDSNLEHLSGVVELHIPNCYLLDGSGFKHLKNVKILNIEGCGYVTDDILTDFEHLEDISMGFCREVTDNGLKSLSKNPIRLLEIQKCKLCTIAGIHFLKGIETLTVDDKRPISMELLDGLPNLKQLNYEWSIAGVQESPNEVTKIFNICEDKNIKVTVTTVN